MLCQSSSEQQAPHRVWYGQSLVVALWRGCPAPSLLPRALNPHHKPFYGRDKSASVDVLVARSRLLRKARTHSVCTIARLYSAGPRVSLIGCEAAAARSAACRILASSRGLPSNDCSASRALMGKGPALVRPIPARVTSPLSSR